jgi:galactokinase
MNQITTSAPGRICLFGEHQDYLGLPVITAAINLRISIEGKKRTDRKFVLDLPDIHDQEAIDLDQPIRYIKERDYFRSSLNVLLRENISISNGYDCVVRGNIPINSGTSSSSALIVAWIQFLLAIASDNRKNDPLEIARFAHRAEVLEFNEPGGMMDHFAASFGSISYIDFSVPGGKQQPLSANLGRFVLGDSRQPKDTKGILARVKHGTLEALKILNQKNRALTIHTLTLDDLQLYRDLLSADQFALLEAFISNRDITQQAKDTLTRKNFDSHFFGNLLNRQHAGLRDGLRISTAKIDGMIEAALQAGAFGAKINGSGGGGCMFAYAPDNYEQVAEAIESAGGIPYSIEVDQGVTVTAR